VYSCRFLSLTLTTHPAPVVPTRHSRCIASQTVREVDARKAAAATYAPVPEVIYHDDDTVPIHKAKPAPDF
jgi:hypothetical protein